MNERATPERLGEIRKRHQAAFPGPYRWFANARFHDVYLATIDRGRIFIMQFSRWGMRNAAPVFQDHKKHLMCRVDECSTKPDHNGAIRITHPDAIALERSWEDRETLLNHIEALEAELATLKVGVVS